MIDERPNVVVVTADSLRADHCGYLGGGELTPTLDRMAADGVAVSNAIAPGPQTFSSVPTTFTGRFRDADLFRAQDAEENWKRRLGAISAHLDRHPPIQERLRELGYATAAVTPNPWTAGASGFDRGFDRFLDRSSATPGGRLGALLEALPVIDPDARPVEWALETVTDRSFFARWESFYEDLLAIRDGLEEPYFLWVFLLDTHIPYIAGRAHRTENSLPEMYYAVVRSYPAMRGHTDAPPTHVRPLMERSYRDTVRAVDAFVERLLADLSADDPAVVFHSDHGESFGEHGHYGHHHRRVYEENIHVPYLLYNAGVEGRVDRPVSLATLPDAVLNLAREGTVDPATLASEFVFSTSELDNHRAVRGTRWKYVAETDEKLFDLSADPDELTNRADDRPDVLARFRRRLAAHDRHVAEGTRLWRAAGELVDRGQV